MKLSTLDHEKLLSIMLSNEILFNDTLIELGGSVTSIFSERVVEVPWLAQKLKFYKPKKLLDIGISLCDQGLMNIYFSSELNDIDMTFIDIIDSSKLIDRVPEEWHEKFLQLNQVEADFLNYKFNGTFDAISCISTLEHFGFDSPNLDETKKKGVFNRSDSPYELISKRNTEIDINFLNSCHNNLSENGKLLLTLPVGSGGEIQYKDSMGLYAKSYEFNSEALETLLSSSLFSVVEETYFKHDKVLGWTKAEDSSALSDQSANLMPHALGVGLFALKKI